MPSLVTALPSTSTRPARINASHCRRLSIPAAASTFCSRSPVVVVVLVERWAAGRLVGRFVGRLAGPLTERRRRVDVGVDMTNRGKKGRRRNREPPILSASGPQRQVWLEFGICKAATSGRARRFATEKQDATTGRGFTSVIVTFPATPRSSPPSSSISQTCAPRYRSTPADARATTSPRRRLRRSPDNRGRRPT